jgi:hypothetical protein
MKKFLIPVIGAAFAFSPVIVPAMFGPAPAHAQAKAKAAAKGKDKGNPMCRIPRDDRLQESWATAYGCWGQKARLQPQPAFAAGPGFGAPGYVGPGFVGPGLGPTPGRPATRAAVRARAR